MNVEIIERLRAAASDHGEVFDLLATLANSFPTFSDGNANFQGTDLDREYLKSAILASEFAKYDCNAGGDIPNGTR